MPAPDGSYYGGADNRSKLIDPAIHAHGGTEDFVKREETAGTIEIAGGCPTGAARSKIDLATGQHANAKGARASCTHARGGGARSVHHLPGVAG